MPAEDAEAAAGVARARVPDALEVLSTSAATGAGLAELRAAICCARCRPRRPSRRRAAEAEAEHRVYRPGAEDGFASSAPGGAPSAWRAAGWSGCSRATTSSNEEALRYLEERLRTSA